MRERGCPSAARRRLRKDQLARRHGARCWYCRRPFTSLREATLDHVVPLSLWRSWSVTSLMLACRACNERKADRLPLLLALVICAHAAATGAVTEMTGDPDTAVSGPGTGGPTTTPSVTAGVTGAVTQVSADQSATGVHPVWLILARLAHAHHPVFTARWSPHRVADRVGHQSPPDQCGSTPVRSRTPRSAVRSGCLHAPRPRRVCGGPDDQAVTV
ncbi:HNH endonuclease [Streptomyces sp. TRM 70351]|uniref:HNH endonuclease n=1 Tax=Streptomyces sp. TRM 70351 TaxID=3116552 RepID=UPI002E7BD049|nr:HNH endonuclease [Streptomyces sp. TRM 70351]MEE1929463.1 HNH endonuclease [Streptomyces sp. TRM 70351]